MNSCCDKNLVWVNKYSDLDVPMVDNQGKPNGEYANVDVNFYVCKVCNAVKAIAD